MAKTKTPPSDDILDWAHVDGRDLDLTKDVLGLSTADRKALGLSAPRTTDLQPAPLAGAEAALAEVLARGGAVAPRPRPEPYTPSERVGKTAPRRP
jgi:hypothetical protein